VIALDASALLAFLFREPGGEAVGPQLPGSVMSSVNLAEVLGRFARDGHDPARVLAALESSSIRWVAFDPALALEVARLEPLTRAAGLSLGDRACLALARVSGLPALTADRAWLGLDVGVEVRCVR